MRTCVDMATYHRCTAHARFFAVTINIRKAFLGSEGSVFPLQCHSACVSLRCYQLATGENIFPATTGTRHRGGWLSSGAATCRLAALIWHGRNGDLTALPQKSGPSDAWKRDLLPSHPHPARLSQVHGTHKVKKSSRPACKCAATACQRRSAVRVSTCARWLGRRRSGGMVRGWGEGEPMV